MNADLFSPFIEKNGFVLLDGAMATELEKKGADLNHVLWSAKLLDENPSLIQEVHSDYLRAGADIITTASYQASYTGFENHGYTRKKATELLMYSSRLAMKAKAEVIQNGNRVKPYPLIAASVGPYGASLADGSEYRGDYGLSVDDLKMFHRERMRVLAESGADLLACETIPCRDEAIALIQLLGEFPAVKAWISFSCKNENQVSHGESFAECAALVNQSEQVLAVGVNCTAPRYVESLVRIAVSVSNKRVIVYPNKGDTWDASDKCWLPGNSHTQFEEDAVLWRNAGAEIIGGCCRTSPEDIRILRNRLGY